MIKPSEFMHPEDAAAIRQLESIPGFPALCKQILALGYERWKYGLNMASTIRLSEEQLPELYRHLPPICEKLGIPIPEFYLQMNPMPNAYTSGDTRVFIVVTSGLVEIMDDDELDAVIAHECGHILCRHVVYNMVAQYVRLGLDYIGLIGKLAKPVQIALDYWSRKSELSCDRCGSIVTSPETVARVMARLAGGPKSLTSKLDMKLWAAQADKYDEIRNGNLWDKSLQIASVLNRTHPFSAVRVREILKWGDSAQYKNLMQNLNAQKSGKKCPKCGKTVDENWAFCMYCGEKL
ncbi:MAG: zinc-ribbon domain-containing protein [Bacteroidales bacterium]|nr:zinc-ribbon domain-containing protein [Bacteroidales bacterium]